MDFVALRLAVCQPWWFSSAPRVNDRFRLRHIKSRRSENGQTPPLTRVPTTAAAGRERTLHAHSRNRRYGRRRLTGRTFTSSRFDAQAVFGVIDYGDRRDGTGAVRQAPMSRFWRSLADYHCGHPPCCGEHWWVDQTPSPFQVFATALRTALFGWAPRGVLTAVLMVLVHRRLGVVFGRLERLMVRFQAGKLVRRVSAPVVVEARERVVGLVPPVNFWPSRTGWLLEAMGDRRHQAAWFSGALEAILREPAWVALLAAAPEARRLLRPVCRMLAVDLDVLCPGVLDPGGAVPEKTVRARVRVKAPPVDFGRIPLPRGILAWARRERRRGGFDAG
jgi:hypothetical protein